MPPSNQTAISNALRQFDPLAGLDETDLDRLARDAELLHAVAGSQLLDIGCEDSRQLFLIEGELELTADDGATHVVRDRDAAARGPLSRLRPSRYRVTARTAVDYLMIEQSLLDASASANAGVIVEESDPVRPPNELLDDSASHPLLYDVFNDINQGRLVVPSAARIAVRVGRTLHCYEDELDLFIDSLMVCPALTLKVLRAARARNRTVRRTRNMHEAVVQLGVEQAYALSVHCVLRETLRTEVGSVSRRMQNWWERSLRISAICRELARTSERFDPQFAALVGLLHGIAEPVMLGFAERHTDLADAAALDNVIQGNRAELGRILFTMWDMPRELIDAAALTGHWGYDHGGEADYTDILLVAQWHSTFGSHDHARVPPLEEIPAFERLALAAASPETSLKIVEAGNHAVDAVSALLVD